MRAVPMIATVAVLCQLVGCMTRSHEKITEAVRSCQRPAWALKASNEKLIVAVSPAGKALRVVGSSGLVVGAVIDASVNAQYRKEVESVLGNFDVETLLSNEFDNRLRDCLGNNLQMVEPLGSIAGYANEEKAAKARLERLRKAGFDLLLDLNASCGLYGPDAQLAVKISSKLTELPRAKTLWANDIVVTYDDILADYKPKDPTDLISPDVSSGLRVNSKGFERWTKDHGALLRLALENVVQDSVKATLCDMGLHESAEGLYHLGKLMMIRKKYEKAISYFEKALLSRPDWEKAMSGRAIAMARLGNVSDAIKLTEEICSKYPDYGPAWYNLAYWYILETDQIDRATECYKKALQLEIPPSQKIEAALGKRKPHE